ncbi:hypothetical protein MK489_01765, partial [Myxococcota bacterium]|nr:hypothetical protein [Myxococcota bacterium]
MAEAIQPPARDLSARWVMGPMRDAALVIGTPLMIVPAAALLLTSVSIERFALYVAAFGSLGHHLPGLLRAYGDRDLFERFRVRFIVAPIALIVVCCLFSLYDLVGLALMAVLWGVWHGLAQVYGFGRIYDAKARAASPLTSRIDLAMCFAWFGAGLFQSPERMGDLLQKLYDCGVPLLAPGAVQGFQTAWMLGTAGVTSAFAVNLFAQWRRGHPPCLPKLLLMASSFTFWWYAMVSIENALLGIAIFEIFHDVQYLTIVWVFNLRVIENGGRVSRFGRYLFRNSSGMIGLYIGLVFAYGFAGIVDESMAPGTLERVLAGIIVASGFLHFYYDGFIWKVREAPTQSGLGLNRAAATRSGPPSNPPGGVCHRAPGGGLVVTLAAVGRG